MDRSVQLPYKFIMSQISTDCYLSIAKKNDTWYVLIIGDALTAGISNIYIQKLKKAYKRFKINYCKIQILLSDGNLDVNKSGKNMFTIDEVEEYINAFKI